MTFRYSNSFQAEYNLCIMSIWSITSLKIYTHIFYKQFSMSWCSEAYHIEEWHANYIHIWTRMRWMNGKTKALNIIWSRVCQNRNKFAMQNELKQTISIVYISTELLKWQRVRTIYHILWRDTDILSIILYTFTYKHTLYAIAE